MMDHSELLVIGGASGVGKSSTAFALHDILSAQDVQHAVVEGDALDLAHPAPWRSGIAFRNLSAIWANYRELGFRRLIFTNTVSVLEARSIADAMGDQPRVTAILLQASSSAIEVRLGKREQGESLAAHVERSKVAAARLDAKVDPSVQRLDTESLTPHEVALQVSTRLKWGE